MHVRTPALLAAIALMSPSQAQTPPRAEPYTIAVPGAVLADLDERLARTRWPDQLPGTGWQYGTDTEYLQELVDYWRNDFDWRAAEQRLNTFDHYRAEVDGLRVHFVHERSRDPNAIPLLLLHGWPSSFVQMLDLVPLLTDPAAHGLDGAPSFHVVAASLPGYGFSDASNRPGVGFATIARMMTTLMHDVLGYSRYGVRGSDLGGVIARQMAIVRPEQVIGVHLTGIIGTAGGAPPYTEAEQAFVDATQRIEPDLAYSRLHMSRPQTLAHALTDSPAGLAPRMGGAAVQRRALGRDRHRRALPRVGRAGARSERPAGVLRPASLTRGRSVVWLWSLQPAVDRGAVDCGAVDGGAADCDASTPPPSRR